MTAIALTIAGSDPSGGAGLQADLKTFHQHRVYGTSVVTLLTVQNTEAVADVLVLNAAFVLAQLEAVVADLPPKAAKTGALGNADIVETVAERVRRAEFPLVVDPVMISKHGAKLMDDAAASALTNRLLPCARLVTPNLLEASVLSGRPVENLAAMEDAARAIGDLGVQNVLVKGGHLEGPAVDVLWTPEGIYHFASARLVTPHTHGTGCVYSAAITARLAQGDELPVAVERAKRFVTAAIRTNPGLGHGLGPTNLFADPDEAPGLDNQPQGAQSCRK
jgi:hydroxymethylpyrimidine/phosphomethylpyrimidine kinase